MKLRFTFGLKTLFISTSILGLVLWAGLWIRKRQEDFASRAFMHSLEAYYTVQFEAYGPDKDKVAREFYYQLVVYQTYHRQMLEKYEYAAKYPWLPVPPDPVAPEKP